MKRPSTRPYLLNPESIALTDMIMNLFIFFFVSFSLLYTFNPDRVARLEVALPKAWASQGSQAAAVTVTVTQEGKHFVEGRPVSEAQLLSELVSQVKRQPRISVLIRADELAPCRSLVAIFDACRGAGITRTSFAIQPREVR